MAKVEVTEIEQQLNGRLLFTVRLVGGAGRMEFPIAIQDQGSAALNELAVLRSTFGIASELAESARLGLG
ncbi:MAG: hypothetical protein ABR970_03275 [Roseiarcus sp.]|jgi:hypothetical protein